MTIKIIVPYRFAGSGTRDQMCKLACDFGDRAAIIAPKATHRHIHDICTQYAKPHQRPITYSPQMFMKLTQRTSGQQGFNANFDYLFMDIIASHKRNIYGRIHLLDVPAFIRIFPDVYPHMMKACFGIRIIDQFYASEIRL